MGADFTFPWNPEENEGYIFITDRQPEYFSLWLVLILHISHVHKHFDS